MILVNRQLNQKLFLKNQKKKVSMTTQTKIETKIKYWFSQKNNDFESQLTWKHILKCKFWSKKPISNHNFWNAIHFLNIYFFAKPLYVLTGIERGKWVGKGWDRHFLNNLCFLHVSQFYGLVSRVVSIEIFLSHFVRFCSVEYVTTYKSFLLVTS